MKLERREPNKFASCKAVISGGMDSASLTNLSIFNCNCSYHVISLELHNMLACHYLYLKITNVSFQKKPAHDTQEAKRQ